MGRRKEAIGDQSTGSKVIFKGPKKKVILPHFRISQNLEGEKGFVTEIVVSTMIKGHVFANVNQEVTVIGDHDNMLIVENDKGDNFHMRTEHFSFEPVPDVEPKPVINYVEPGPDAYDGQPLSAMTFDEAAQWAQTVTSKKRTRKK